MLCTSTQETPDTSKDEHTLSYDAVTVIEPRLDMFTTFLICNSSTVSRRNHIISASIIAGSNISYYPYIPFGACTWILSTLMDVIRRGGGLIKGDPTDQSAYQSELGV